MAVVAEGDGRSVVVWRVSRRVALCANRLGAVGGQPRVSSVWRSCAGLLEEG